MTFVTLSLSVGHKLFSFKIVKVGLIAALIMIGDALVLKNIKGQAQIANRDGSSASISTSNPNCHTCTSQADRAIYIPLIYLPEAQSGQIVFNSRSGHVIDVTPVFYTIDGTSFTGDSVSIDPSEIRYVNVRTLIPAAHRNRTDWGGLALRFYGANREMWAQYRFLGVNGGNNIDEFFTVDKEFQADTQAATWWAPLGSQSVIVLANVTDVNSSATVNLGNDEMQIVNLPPHGTEIIRQAHPDQQRKKSVDIITTGQVGSIIATGMIETANHNSNSVIRFYDTKHAKQSNLYANGLTLRHVTPHLILHNTSAVPITAVPKFSALSGSAASPITLPLVNLDSNQTVDVNLSPLMSAVNNRADLKTVSVEVDTESPPGSLIGAIYTTDQTTGLTSDTPLRDSGPTRNMTGAYPWKVGNGFSTLAYVTNITDVSQGFIGQINFPGGRVGLRPRYLAPGETAVIDVKQMRNDGFSDDLGQRIPLDATQGQLVWSTYGLTGGKQALIGRAVMKNNSDDIVTSYSCQDNCPTVMSAGNMVPSSQTVEVGDTIYAVAWEQPTYLGTPGTPFIDYSVAWASEDTAVASDGFYYDYEGTAEGAGETQVDVHLGDYEDFSQDHFDEWECHDNMRTYSVDSQISVVVKPTITGISPSRGVVGTTAGASSTSVTITGTGFISGSTSIGMPSGITVVGSPVVSGTTSITANFAISASATPGNRPITVTVRAKTSSPYNFYVQIPTSLVPQNIATVAPSGVGPLQTPVNGEILGLAGQVLDSEHHATGVGRNYAWTIVDQDGQRILNALTFDEVFSNACLGHTLPPAQLPSTIPAGSYAGDNNRRYVIYPDTLFGYDCFDQRFYANELPLNPLYHIEVGLKSGTLISNRTVVP